MREFDEVTTQAAGLRHREVSSEQAVPGVHVGRAAAQGRPEAMGAAGLLRLQRAVGNAGTASMMQEERSPVHDVVAAPGEEIDADVRGDMEARLGHDFSDVRVHRDSAAHESAQSVQAKAYTVGSHMVFQRDAYDPGSDAGRHVLAHELTHVVQQRSGPVDGSAAPGGIRVSDPSDRYERAASESADRALSLPAGAPGVQRQDEPEEEETAQTYVQREDAPEEEETAQTYVQREDAPEEEEAAQTYVQRQDETEEEPA